MRIKSFVKFFEDGVAAVNASTTAGAGGVVAPTVGQLPGVAADSGSGDLGFSLGVERLRRKKGTASEVTDLRDLEDVEVDVVDDIKEASDKLEGLIVKVEKAYSLKIEGEPTLLHMRSLEKCLGLFERKFIVNKIDLIDFVRMKSRGQWEQKKKTMRINPKIFEYRKRFRFGSVDIPYYEFCIIHEIGHCVDYIKRVSFGSEWRSISGWRKCERDERIPEGYVRYIEKRPGRTGPKKSDWVSREGSDFCRKYSGKNPKEDFADCLAFAILGLNNQFDSVELKRKFEIVKSVLKTVS